MCLPIPCPSIPHGMGSGCGLKRPLRNSLCCARHGLPPVPLGLLSQRPAARSPVGHGPTGFGASRGCSNVGHLKDQELALQPVSDPREPIVAALA
jgi:hypothetical protein